MPSTLTIEGKVPGKSRPLFDDWRLPLPPEWEGGEPITLRDLLMRVVREEVRAFKDRQEARRTIRALTHADIQSGLMKGKVDSGGRELTQEVDEEAAVATALQAFEDGIYYVFVDDEQAESLDAEVHLRPDGRVTFLRLVALAGG